MRPLKYSINVSLDGCVDHAADFVIDEDTHLHATRTIEEPDALIFGRTTYELMEFWRDPGDIPDWMVPFADAISAKKKYLVSSTRHVDTWNTEQLEGDVVEAVRALKEQPGGSLLVGGVRLPVPLAEAGLIDEYQLVVHPRVIGHGPYLFEGMRSSVALTLIEETAFASGVVVRRYVPVGSS
jgi:dihydrofolate reductase